MDGCSTNQGLRFHPKADLRGPYLTARFVRKADVGTSAQLVLIFDE